MLVTIREAECIGCTKCIQACPVDCIIGSANLMHTVLASECIGCELCIPACPVDCISLVTGKEPTKNKELSLKRSRAKINRLKIKDVNPPLADTLSKKEAINATIARIKAMQIKK